MVTVPPAGSRALKWSKPTSSAAMSPEGKTARTLGVNNDPMGEVLKVRQIGTKRQNFCSVLLPIPSLPGMTHDTTKATVG